MVEREEAIGSFLLRRLKEVGLSHLFGVPGDCNLELLELIEADAAFQWIGCCNELNAAYAADGYARTHGLSALITSYGAGELSALCGIAGAFAEHVPVIHITGAPPFSVIDRCALMLHTAGDGNYDNMMVCGRTFSTEQSRITPQNAVAEIDRCLRGCIQQKQPAYIQIPSDVAYTRIRVPAQLLEVAFRSDEEALDDFIAAAMLQIDAATTCAILVDADVGRFGHTAIVLRLAEKLGCGIAVMGTAKGLIDEAHPSFLGVYAGAFSAPWIREAVEQVDCLIQLAVRFIDSSAGSFAEHITPKRSIEIHAWRGRVDQDDFQGVYMGHMLEGLVAAVHHAPRTRTGLRVPPLELNLLPHLSHVWFWTKISSFLREGDIVVADHVSSLSGVAGMPLPRHVSVISQALWGAVGYALPATFGSLIAAPHRRHLLFIGDGSFQLTAQELSSILRHLQTPVIFLINTGGYSTERSAIGKDSSYNDVQPWQYASLCESFAGRATFNTRRVSTPNELEVALEEVNNSNHFFFIEVMISPLEPKKAFGAYVAPDSIGDSDA